MKKNIFSILSLILIGTMFVAGGCSDKKEAPAKKEVATKTAAATLPNYRYVDADTVLVKYNLSKDFEEEMLRMQSNYDNEGKKHTSQIQNMQNSMQKKYQNNGYATEDAFKADQQRLLQMNNSAEQAMGKLQQTMLEAQERNAKILNDSLQNFITEYNKLHGYDAIFYKAATLYIDPRLDITEEVIEGLNARYNKVKK